MSRTTPTKSGAYSLPPERRRGGLRRAVWAIAKLALLGGVLLGTWVGIDEYRTVRARDAYFSQREALRAAGEPVLPTDVAARHLVPDDQNAVIPLRRAAARIPDLDPAQEPTTADWPFVVPLSDVERAYIDRRTAQIDAVVADVRDAARRGGAHWPVTYAEPMVTARLPDLGAQRQLVYALDYAALRALDRGDYAAAFDLASLNLTVGRAMSRHPSVYGYLTANGMNGQSRARIADVLARAPVGAPVDRVIDPATVRRVLAALLDESVADAAIGDSIWAARAETTDLLERVVSGAIPKDVFIDETDRPGRFLGRPSYWAAAERVLDYTSAARRAAAAPNWPAARALLPTDQRWSDSGDRGERVAGRGMAAVPKWTRWHYHELADRRLTAVAVAVYLYRQNHVGLLPSRLADLVPAYLPAVPIDPMAADGAVVRFAAGLGDARVYSIGADGVDDAGRERNELPGTPEVRARQFDAGDIVVALSPKLRPATRPAGDDPAP